MDRLEEIEIELRKRISELKTAQCEKSLAEFTRQAWHIIEPETPLMWNWHLDVLCSYLEAAHHRKIIRLIINVPPGSLKSILVSVMFPAWVWISRPDQRILGISNVQDLAIRDATKTKRIVTDDWYQQQWSLTLRADQSAKTNYENTKAGFRGSLGITGNITGKRGDLLLIDDPHDATTVQSDTQRQTVIDTYDSKISTRINHQHQSVIILIMQRLHHIDLAGHLLSKSKTKWTHVCIPMEYEKELTYDAVKHLSRDTSYNVINRSLAREAGGISLGKIPPKDIKSRQELIRKEDKAKYSKLNDPRKKEGELLFPALFNAATVESLKEDMGEFIAAGQLQQRPSVKGGGILKQHWWRIWDDTNPLPTCEHIFTSWDTAFSEKDRENNSHSACTEWGIFWNIDQQRDCLMLLNVWHDQVDYPTLRKKAQKLEEELKPDCHLIEKKASGQSLIQDLKQAGIFVKAYNPDKDKVTRAYTIQAMLESGQIYIPDRKWAHNFTHLLSTFPTGIPVSEDLTDTFTQAALYLKNSWHIVHPGNLEDEKPKAYKRKSAYG